VTEFGWCHSELPVLNVVKESEESHILSVETLRYAQGDKSVNRFWSRPIE
jgi:hypothetical protein